MVYLFCLIVSSLSPLHLHCFLHVIIWVLLLPIITTSRPPFFTTHFISAFPAVFLRDPVFHARLLCSVSLSGAFSEFSWYSLLFCSFGTCLDFSGVVHRVATGQLLLMASEDCFEIGSKYMSRDSKGLNKNDYYSMLFWHVLFFFFFCTQLLWLCYMKLPWGDVGRETGDINDENWSEYLLLLLYLTRLNISDCWLRFWGLMIWTKKDFPTFHNHCWIRIFGSQWSLGSFDRNQ